MASGWVNGEYRVEITGRDEKRGPNGGRDGADKGPKGESLVINNGQLGYWVTETYRSNREHDFTRTVFVPVGPSEAAKAATAAKALQDQKNAEAAAKNFAAQTATAAAIAEQNRQAAIFAAATAGQYQSVSQAEAELNTATTEAARLKDLAASALNAAQAKRQEAINAIPVAAQAEKTYQDLRTKISTMTLKNGYYGTVKREVVKSTKNSDVYGNVFYSSGISQAQVIAAETDAVNKRNIANNLPKEATTAEQASLQATASYNAAETRRQAAQAALTASREAAERAAEAERQRQLAEAAAAAAAEQQRQAEAAAKAAEEARIAAERAAALQARQTAANKLFSTDIQSVRGIPLSAEMSLSPLSWSVASAGGITLAKDTAGTVMSRMTAILAELRSLAVASMTGPVAVTIMGLLYSRDVGAGSDVVPGRDISALTPAEFFSLPDMATLAQAAETSTPVAMPVRGHLVEREDGTLETQFIRFPEPGDVKVVQAEPDSATGYWGYTLPAMPGVPAQTILISPADAPGLDAPLTLTGPVPLPETIIHTGDQDTAPQGLTITTTPVADDLDFADVILIFPAESGLRPLYVMLRSRRNMPGTVSGNGQKAGENWLDGASTGDGAPLPEQIAEKLNGKNYSSFDSFRNAFWRAVAVDPELSKQFSTYDLNRMQRGRAPVADFTESAGKRVGIELHHKVAIYTGGEVYDVDNLSAVTPKRHINIHKGE
ncbi:S-type pyocin domain-containing protein [Kosakonia sp. MUSA4]|uniref:S-type pyocin domain-containing protein n=1 Tax=Kosakonia sp. MUSA4 TaxID=2067958 RepID=UPI0015994A6E|nr:S-type pyocin domain-containing protein [Kosakonia sp. MUSA4]QJT78667.1 klebicin B [Kosakonia sp. MUSA4]